MAVGVVAAETSHLRTAVLESCPVESIAKVCNGNLEGETFDRAEGGFVGGTLLNITTAAFSHLRTNPSIALSERPLELDRPAESVVGQVLVGLFNGYPSSEDQNLSPVQITFAEQPLESEHYCNEAEAKFVQSLADPSARRTFLSEAGEAVLLRKDHGAQTFLVLPEHGALFNEAWVPDGTIAVIEYNHDYDAFYGTEGESFMALAAVRRIAALRLGVPAIPREQRGETFQVPSNYRYAGYTEERAMQFPTMDAVRDELSSTRPASIASLLPHPRREIQTIAA